MDDGSTDATMQILHQYASIHPNMQVHQNEQNLGYIKNFEKGMGLANGYFISPCDQDDVWDTDKIRLMVEAIGDFPMIFCDSELVDENLVSMNKKISTLKNLQTFNNCLYFVTDNCVAGHATLFTKKLFEATTPFNTTIAHDWWLPYVSTFFGGIQYLDKSLVLYRNHTGNVIGAVKTGTNKKTWASRLEKKKQERATAKKRLQLFYDKCPDEFIKEKEIIKQLIISYDSFSLRNNFKRVVLYLKYQSYFLAIKKRTVLYKYIFCLKMFFKMR